MQYFGGKPEEKVHYEDLDLGKTDFRAISGVV
jgi:hypothetical protein